MNQVIVKEQDADVAIQDIQNTNKMVQALMQTPHYRKMGADGIFAVVTKAKSVGVDPIDALNGGMYYVQGKVEMSSQMMNHLIRGGHHKHSITKDKKSDDTICILHGKRADNGDTWVESFSIEDAKRAGIYRNQWLKYPKDMLFARALSRLARQLFPDVIKGCYVQGEIADAPAFDAPVKNEEGYVSEIEVSETQPEFETITAAQYEDLDEWIGGNMKLRQDILNHLKTKWKVEGLRNMPISLYDFAIQRAMEERAALDQHLGEEQQAMEA